MNTQLLERQESRDTRLVNNLVNIATTSGVLGAAFMGLSAFTDNQFIDNAGVISVALAGSSTFLGGLYLMVREIYRTDIMRYTGESN